MNIKRTNRVLAILLTLMMVIGMFPMTAFAAAWDGDITDRDWNGSGTQQDPYLLSSAEELAGQNNGRESRSRVCKKKIKVVI